MSDAKLDLVLKKLESMENDMKSMKNEMETVTNHLKKLDTKTDYIQSDVTTIKDSIERIDHAVNEDVLAILKTIENKTNDNDADIVVLNNRLFKVESKIQKIIG
ncbi:hypothetical protein [Pseudogracilibacillus sp. SO30301A]|uniref:hypothetical protein n=1 Tax=Pseudogracilibacillus sp. SO30301A TaxID=3098291 RepID=UPI00300DE004